jgi:hypothetical protein
VTRRRDQLHRLTFYLDRVARAATPFERTAPLWPAAALTPLGALITAAGDALRHRTAGTNDSSAGGGSVGWRSLQLTLANLAEEFPHLTGPRPALAALSDALAQLTDQAWQLLTEGQQRLHVAPVPVRPLQLTLGRLDTLRNLEVFVDRPERPRSALLDGIEALRLAFEQARATRDRLTASAEHALARGHWTTGLFDMERAVAGLRADDDQDRAQAAQLQERLATARKQKQEIEAATRRNVELTTQYVTLQDDSTSTFAARLQVLGERRDVLLYLGMYVTADRASLYRQDLRDVETQIALEHAAFAEHQLDGSTDPLARAALARTTLARLTESMTGNEHGLSPSGRLVRVHEHWRTLAERCQQTLDDLATSQRARQRQRHRIAAFALLAVVTTAAAIAVAVQSWLRPPPAMAATRDGR